MNEIIIKIFPKFKWIFEDQKKIMIYFSEDSYSELLEDPAKFREYLDIWIEECPELFPSTVSYGYNLHDISPESKKRPGFRTRRIELKIAPEGKNPVFTIHPSFMLTYNTGTVAEVEKALFLRKFGVPYWALTHLFGHDDDYWYRICQRFGHNSVVGTTIKDKELLPKDLVVDEKHTKLNGEKAYVATTIASECVLGVSVSPSADIEGLTRSYGEFKKEALNVDPDYSPETVNTDGWEATKSAWISLFPHVQLILCFLHGFLKILNASTKKVQNQFQQIADMIWNAYREDSKDGFLRQIELITDWMKCNPIVEKLKVPLEKFCKRKDEYAKVYDYPNAHRTSNMVDRNIQSMDRYLFCHKYFHGHLSSAEYGIRAWALIHNFAPYSPRSKISKEYLSPAQKLNKKCYNENWVHNLIISTSMGGFRC